MNRFPFGAAWFALALLGASAAQGADPLLLQSPTLSEREVAFAWAGDLWSVGRNGGVARQLTAGVGIESHPRFSPDGNSIAFSGQYDGNTDVYVMPAAGGPARRLTWHPGEDMVVAWSPDGSSVFFVSHRASGTDDAHLFEIPAAGGWPQRVPLPSVAAAAISPDARRIAYVPHLKWQAAWKRYRGGQTTPIWIVDRASLTLERIPRQNSNDQSPMWYGDDVFFLSDRDGAVALYRYEGKTKQVTPTFPNDGLDLKSASAGPGAIVVEGFGRIGLYDPAAGAMRWLSIQVAGDTPGARPHWVEAAKSIQSSGLSPTGKRAVFGARGDVFTVPAEKGDIRNLTRSSDAADRDPAWSPDGKSIAYLSDASGEYALYITTQDGAGESRRIPLGDPPSFFYAPAWSPDGKQIALTDKRLTLWLVDVKTGAVKKVDSDFYETPERSLEPAWSPDSRFLAYTKQLPSHLHAVFVYSLEDKSAHQATDGFSDARYPAFDRGGKFLAFAASTNWGPTAPWLDMSSVEHPVARSLYLAVLDDTTMSPLAPESDEEPAKAEEAVADDGKNAGKEAKEGEAAETPETPAPVVIDFPGLMRRTLPLPMPPRNYIGLFAGKAGELFVLETPDVIPVETNDPLPFTVHKFTFKDRKATKLDEALTAFALSANGEKMLIQRGEDWSIVGTGEPEPEGEGKGPLDLDEMQAYVDPGLEWRQMYHETWRIQRDFFYDPHVHGLDIGATERKYAVYLPGLAHRVDLNYLFTEMLGETSVGHTFIEGGDLPEPPSVPCGLLGADYEIENGRYRFARIYDGESWNPDLTAPLTAPGARVMAGEFLIEVEGRDVRPPASVYSFFENTAGKRVRLRVAKRADGGDGRDVTVVPVDDEHGLRYRAWVEDNRRTVDRMSGGKLAYMHLPDTGAGGYLNFNRYFFAQVDKSGVIVDERYNHGGLLADYVVDFLNRPLRSWCAPREGADFRSPGGALFGPKVMIINEMSGSGGDVLPWYFRKANTGTLVGTRTWGGLVGIYDYPVLLDGGHVTAPRVGIYGLEGKWEVENRGIEPDITVEMTPADCRGGQDPQLTRAVAVALAALAQDPPRTYPRPPYPNYQTTPWQSEAKP